MAQDFSLNQPQAFQCPNCREFINASMSNCSYCGVAINHEAAMAAANVQAKVGQACSDASYLKITARAFVLFYLLDWIPFMPLVGWGALILFIAVPVMLVRWWVKYSKLQTADPDYEKAKRDTIISAVIWSALVALWFIIIAINILLVMFGGVGI